MILLLQGLKYNFSLALAVVVVEANGESKQRNKVLDKFTSMYSLLGGSVGFDAPEQKKKTQDMKQEVSYLVSLFG